MTKNHHHLFRTLFLINFLITLGFGISDAFFPLYCQNIGARGLLLGAAIGGYALSKIIFSPIMGALADRFGRKPLILFSLGGYLLISCSYLVFSNLTLVVVLRLLQGAGCAMFRPVLQALVADHTPAERRGTVMGTFDISFYAALSAGPVLGGLMMDIWGFQGMFIILSLCCFCAFCLACVGIPACSRKPGTSRPFFAAGLTRLWPPSTDKGPLRGLLLFILGRACGITACAAFLPILLTSKMGLSGFEVGVVMASATVTMTLLLRPVGRVADYLPRPLLVACGGVVVPMLYLLLPVVADFGQVLGVSLGIGAFSALSQPAASSLLIEEGQRLGMGATLGTFNAFLNLGFVLGPVLGSLLQSSVGIQSVFIAIGIIGLISALGFAATIRVHQPVQQGQVTVPVFLSGNHPE
jgi:MFS family permease